MTKILKTPALLGVVAFLVPIAAVIAVAIAMNASASATAPATDLAGTEYCYTSSDGDWLICKLED